MTALLILFAVYILMSGLYIRKLHAHIRVHEEAWKQIGTMTDHNQEGDIIIHAHRVPDDMVLEPDTDEEDMERLLEQRDQQEKVLRDTNEEITALAHLMRLMR